MSVSVKSNREIELMREAGKILGTVLNELSKDRAFLKASNLQKKAVIYMKFQMQLLHTMKATGTA